MTSLKLIPAALTALFIPAPALARHYHPPVSTQFRQCYEVVTKERYFPGTHYRPGYVQTYRERVRVPCRRNAYHPNPPQHTYPPVVPANNCLRNGLVGGLLGAATGAAVSRGDGRSWAVPAGAGIGILLGCQAQYR